MSSDTKTKFTLHHEDELERAISDYLNLSRNKNNTFMYRDWNYWPQEERLWNRLKEALARNGIVVYSSDEEEAP